MMVKPLDPQRIWTLHVQGRSVIYLDTSVWVRLTDARTPTARECLSACRDAVDTSRAIFPLSFASISEVLQQPLDAPRGVQARLMDELSLGVTIRSADAVQNQEARAAFGFFANEDHLPVSGCTLFSYVIDYLADGALAFPQEATQAQIASVVDHWNTIQAVRSVVWLLEHLDLDELRARYRSAGEEFVEQLGRNIKTSSEHFREKRQFSSTRLRHEERLALFKSIVLPCFSSLLLERYAVHEIPDKLKALARDFNRRNGQGRPALLESLFALMPATELYVQLNASSTLNPTRAVRPQDFWDVEHARVAAAYCDAFVANDRGLMDLLATRTDVPHTRGCRLLSDLEQLKNFLHEDLGVASKEPV